MCWYHLGEERTASHRCRMDPTLRSPALGAEVVDGQRPSVIRLVGTLLTEHPPEVAALEATGQKDNNKADAVSSIRRVTGRDQLCAPRSEGKLNPSHPSFDDLTAIWTHGRGWTCSEEWQLQPRCAWRHTHATVAKPPGGCRSSDHRGTKPTVDCRWRNRIPPRHPGLAEPSKR